MDDLISRQKALNTFEKWLSIKGYSEGEMNMLKGVIYELRYMPSAQPERKTGKWITKSTKGEIFDCCSQCGYVEWDSPNKYCPNCGADMRGEDNV